MGRRAKTAKGKTDTEHARAPKVPQDDGAKVRDLEKRLAEALEQQTATSEILRAITYSPTDVQPVFDTIVRNAGAVCGAFDASVFLWEAEHIVLRAHWGPIQAHTIGTRLDVSRETVAGRAILEGQPVHVEDLCVAPDFPDGQTFAREFGYRTTLAVPLLREGRAAGALLIRRTEVSPFSTQQIDVIKTFAAQAVIAIENVRRFNDTKEALEQQTATSAILKVIASSPTDTQPVFDAIAENASRLCGVADGFIALVDGDTLRAVSVTGQLVARTSDYDARRVLVSRESVAGRAIVDRATIHIPDLVEVSETEFPEVRALQQLFGHRTMLAIPLLREGAAVGAIVLFRFEVRSFSARQIELLKTFADQAVIAIENVRLFTELQEKSRALTQAHAEVSEALEQQTATSEILRVIAHAQTDAQPVFDMIVRTSVRLCHASHAAVFVTDGRLVSNPANYGSVPEALAAARARFPGPSGWIPRPAWRF
jgi:GAF domain-containing protein